MYCSSCGSPVTPELSYCNRCGAALTTKLAEKKSRDPRSPTLHESLVWAIVAVSVGGLALLIGLMALLKNELHFENGMILLISLLSFALLLGAEAVFVWVLVNSQRRAQTRETTDAETSQVKGSATKELAEPRERMLVEPAISITEHTTRTLEPVYRERKNS